MIDNVLQFKPRVTEPQPAARNRVAASTGAVFLYGYAIARAQAAPRTSDTPPRYEAK